MSPVTFAVPPTTLDWSSVTLLTRSGFTVNVAGAAAVPFIVALTAALAAVVTVFDVTVKVADVAPAGTTIFPGTVAAAVLLLASVTRR